MDKTNIALRPPSRDLPDSRVPRESDVRIKIANWIDERGLDGFDRLCVEAFTDFYVEAYIKSFNEARLEYSRHSLYLFLNARSIAISDEVRARVEAELQLDQLDAWIKRAVTARSIDDVFA